MFYLDRLRQAALAGALSFSLAQVAPAALAAATPQGDTPPARDDAPRSETASPDGEQGEPALLASDGAAAKPGRVPAGTPEPTAAAWKQLADTLTVPRPAATPGTPLSFKLAVAVRVRDEQTGSKDFNARFSYLDTEAGYVAMELLDDDDRVVSVQMRGPDPARPDAKRRLSHWFRKDRGEGTTDGWIDQSGGEYASDRQQVDRWAIASHDIARILTPRSMRIVDLRELAPAAGGVDEARILRLGDDPGVVLPDVDVTGVRGGRAQQVSELAAGLRWLELRTPDFRLFETELGRVQREALRRQVKRVVFGIDPKTSRPSLVIVSPRAEGPLQQPGALLMQCTEWFAQDANPEVVLPGRFYAYETVAAPGAPTGHAFSGTSTADLYLLQGSTIGANLEPGDFVPEQ